MDRDETWRQLHGEGGGLDRDVEIWRRALEDRQLKVAEAEYYADHVEPTRPEPEPKPDP